MRPPALHPAPLLIAGLLIAGAPPAAGAMTAQSGQATGTHVDGIAAVVNDEIISIGEVRRAAALLREGAAAAPSGCGSLESEPAPLPGQPRRASQTLEGQEAERAAVECLIDRVLVFREVRRFPQLDAPATAIAEAYRAIESSFDRPAEFHEYLQRHDLTPQELRGDLRRQLLIAAYVDTRFRATVDVSAQEARQVYADEIVPDMRSRGIEVPAFEAVADDFVIPLLREREVNRRVQSWVQDLRTRATIVRKYP